VTDFRALLQALAREGVEFIIVGGVAAAAHGSSRVTRDLHVVYSRTRDNLGRLARALGPTNPRLRGAPDGLPFLLDEVTLRRGLNFTLATDAGDLDILGEITGGGGFDALLAHSIIVPVFESQVRCIDLATLIRVKRAAGRPKDLEAIAELEALLEERDR